MQQTHIPTREEADANLATFYGRLGHRPPLDLTANTAPRLSGAPVHATLSATVERLRRARPEAAIVRPIRRHIATAPRLARQRFVAARDRAFNVACAAVLVAMVLWVGAPVAATVVMAAL